MSQDNSANSTIIAERLKRMMAVHSWEELTQIDAFREDVEQLIKTTLEQ